MDKIGDYSVLGHSRLLVPAGETAVIEFPGRGHFTIVFETTEEGKPRDVHFKGVGHGVIVTARNWNNSLGTSMETPVKVGEDDKSGDDLYLFFAAWGIGDTRVVELQLMSKKPNEEATHEQ